MPLKPKFETGQTVLKWTGDYQGPGIVRGIAGLANGKLRYLVGHKIEGGIGEFLHVYAEGNLREIDVAVIDPLATVLAPDHDLPSADEMSKASSSRTPTTPSWSRPCARRTVRSIFFTRGW